MRALLITMLCALTAAPAMAEGLAVKDLQTLQVDPSPFRGGAFQAQATGPDRLTIFCTDCDQVNAIDISLGKSTDGTEDRYRSGETTIQKMREICQNNNATCELDAAEVGGAVGWVTSYQTAFSAGSTTVLFLDGDVLTIRALAADKETAIANGALAREKVAPLIVEGP